MKSFLIPADETPEQAALRKRQAVAQALASNMPSNVGEGIASLGNALAYRQDQNQQMFPQSPGAAKPSFMTAMKNMLTGGRNGGLY